MSRFLAAAALASFIVAAGPLGTGPLLAADDLAKTPLKPFNVTIRVFDPAKGAASGQDYLLPVDSPDAEHAAASTLANAASFTKKTDAIGKAVPVAFLCVKIEPR